MLADCNLKIHPDKSVFGTNIIEYLGHNVVGQHGIAMNEAKVEAIKALPIPKCVADLRSILGFLSYYRHFIPGFSTLTAPLTALIKKGQAWLWGPQQDSAYTQLRRLMTEPGRVLKPIDPKRELIVHTDWSTYGIGAVLGQLDDEGHEYLCACASRSLSKHERNYPPYKGELLALTWAIQTFRPHVHGTKFRLVTDHQPLLWLMKARDLNGQYARWQMMLQEHDFEIEHRAGVKHNNADVLSRFPMPHTHDRTGAQFDPDPVPSAPEVVAVAQPVSGRRWREVLKKLKRLEQPAADNAQHVCSRHGKNCPGFKANSYRPGGIPPYRWGRSETGREAGSSHQECWDKCKACCIEQMSKPGSGVPRGRVHDYCDAECHGECQDIWQDHDQEHAGSGWIQEFDCSLHGKQCPGVIHHPPPAYRQDAAPGFPWDASKMPKGASRTHCELTCRRCCAEAMQSLDPAVRSPYAAEYCCDMCATRCKPQRKPPPAAARSLVAKLPGSGIDCFAPKFRDLLKHDGVTHVDENYYMEAAMKPPESELDELDDPLLEYKQEAKTAVLAAISAAQHAQYDAYMRLSDAIQTAKDEAVVAPPRQPSRGAALDRRVVDTTSVGKEFFAAAEKEGISLLELCGGIGAGLEAVLRAGIRINRYLYCDIDPSARRVIRFKLRNLSGRYPHLLPITAWAGAFDLPQDINLVQRDQLHDVIGHKNDEQWLVVAGWPCQDYSAAGKGKIGERASLLDRVLYVIQWLTATGWRRPAYILENVAMQYNFSHSHIRFPVYEELCSKLGDPITLDAAQAGSYAHRLRNYWTNLADGALMQNVLDCLDVPRPTQQAKDVLKPNRFPAPVAENERSQSGRTYNVPGQPRVTFPTLMAFKGSRAFRPTKPGSVYDATAQMWTEPDADERELIMGYEAGSTAADGVSIETRRQLLSQAIDLNALLALLLAAKGLTPKGVLAQGRLPVAAAVVPQFRLCSAAKFSEAESADKVVQDAPGEAPIRADADIWNDPAALKYLRNGTVPTDARHADRVRKRGLLYVWRNNRLFRRLKDRQTGALCERLVVSPELRQQTILDVHADIGHLGEKRTIAALGNVYWWGGMSQQVKDTLKTCILCQRVGATAPHVVQDMQTSSHHEYGIGYRWGLDYAGELPESRLGNKYVLIMIDYYSKWIEAIPCKTADALTTMREVLLNLIARYGTPGEVLTDNGAPFKGEFEQFLAKRQITHRAITPGLPRSNGLAERAVKTVKYALKKHAADRHHALDWDTEGLAAILMGYRCTPHAATGFSPAQILFAQDPAVNADHWVSRVGAIDYDEFEVQPEQVATALLERAVIAAEMAPQIIENLRLAHLRNAARFRALRSGLYVPKIYHFRVGDHVFILHHEETIPGGALGIRARNEILTVTKVNDNGTLELVNQSGRTFTRHVEQCAPCAVPNIDGTIHTGLFRPGEKHPCTRCGDHRQPAKMLMCDGCTSGWHTYCLPVPLDEVPPGLWLCPDCLKAGITPAQIQANWENYIEAPEPSRPHIELPSPARLRRAQQVADEWHGQVVEHQRGNTTRVGRLVFQDVRNPNWIRIHWVDGTEEEFTTRILPRLAKIPEAQAPGGDHPKTSSRSCRGGD